MTKDKAKEFGSFKACNAIKQTSSQPACKKQSNNLASRVYKKQPSHPVISEETPRPPPPAVEKDAFNRINQAIQKGY